MTPPWSPSQEDVMAALALLGSTDDARIKAAAKGIYDYEPEPSHVIKDRLYRLADALKEALRLDTTHLLSTTFALKSDLELAECIARQQADATRTGRSGGARIAGAKMFLAAWEAHELCWDHDIIPTLTVGGKYLNLTSLLFRMATGQERDPTHACTAMFRELGYHGGEVRRARRQAQQLVDNQLGQLTDEELAQLILSRRS